MENQHQAVEKVPGQTSQKLDHSSSANDILKHPLPSIPDKLYFSIGEASELCLVEPHVLRYWEQEFSQLKPSKRRGNRRYYQRDDVILIRNIRGLLYEQGFTIAGARAKLGETKEAKIEATDTKKTACLKDILHKIEAVISDLK